MVVVHFCLMMLIGVEQFCSQLTRVVLVGLAPFVTDPVKLVRLPCSLFFSCFLRLRTRPGGLKGKSCFVFTF